MKKIFTAKYFSLLMLLALFGSKVEARYQEGDCCAETRDCGSCMTSCYECGCNPLYCGAWDLQVQAGVAPVIWRQRGTIDVVSCSGSVTNPIFTLFDTPKFSRLFKTPWIVGGQIGYAWSDNTRVYLEFNYSQAKRKHHDFLIEGNLVTPNTTFAFDTGKFKVFDAYVGVRYYWDRWCDRISFFLGGKVGLNHHKRARFNGAIAIGGITPVTIITDADFFRSNTMVAGGANIGLDICFCGNWSFVITGEVVATCGPRNNGNILIPTNNTPFTGTNLIIGHIGTELRFPVTAAIRYSF
jgi:hypothetical protein